MTGKTVEGFIIKDGKLTTEEFNREINNILKEYPDVDRIDIKIVEKEVIPVTSTMGEDK